MIPWVQEQGIIPNEDIEMLSRIRRILKNLPDLDLSNDSSGQKILLSCHILARALANHFRLEYRDGHYCRRYEHAWLVTPQSHIIDFYPIATVGGPIMIAHDFVNSTRLYQPCHARQLTPKFSDPSFRRAVKILIRTIQTIDSPPA